MTEQDAIRDSIRHWQENKAIVLANVTYEKETDWPIFGKDCALCQLAKARLLKERPSDKGTYCHFCSAECWDMWREVLNLVSLIIKGEDVPQADWERVCDAMIAKLKSLLET